MSFVNLYGNDIWSETDIVNKTEAMIHSTVSIEMENILNRKVTASVIGQYVLTNEDKALLDTYQRVCLYAQEEGNSARTDMALLLKVFPVESAMKRLALPVVEPILDDEGNVTNQDDIDKDTSERTEAQDTIDSADQETKDLVLLRNPIGVP